MEQKKFEDLQLQDDFMFCAVMSNPQYCKPFLERVLGKKISHIEYPNTQETINLSAEAKGIRLDVYTEGDNEVYNIEMQTTDEKNLAKRARYYQGAIDINLLNKGENYKQLKPSFIIFVCTFDYPQDGRHIYTFKNLCVENTKLLFGDETTKIVLNTKGTADDISPELKTLLDYIDGKQPEDDFTRNLDEAVKTVRNNEKWRTDYMTLQMRYQEKYDEGYDEGIEAEKKQTVLRMLEAGKLSPEDIAEYSDLTLEQVLDIQKELQPA